MSGRERESEAFRGVGRGWHEVRVRCFSFVRTALACPLRDGRDGALLGRDCRHVY